MILGLQPSYWQQIAAGVAVIVPSLLVGALLLGWCTRSVLRPRAAGRPWPEGARGIRPVVELIVDLQRRGASRRAAVRAWLQPVRFGLVVAACAVVPLSSGLVLTDPGLGVYVFALVLGLDAVVEAVGAPDDELVAASLPVRAGLAVVVAIMAGVVHAQWGTGSVAAVVTSQADGAVGGIDLFGLPTAVVHPLAATVATGAVFVTLVAMASSRAVRDGGPTGTFAGIVDQAWVIAGAAWLVVAFAGGGAVPWSIDNDGTRHVVSVAVISTKITLVALALAWARATWPTVSVRSVRVLVAAGGIGGILAIGATLLVRHLV